jgi:hypothetical protein
MEVMELRIQQISSAAELKADVDTISFLQRAMPIR